MKRSHAPIFWLLFLMMTMMSTTGLMVISQMVDSMQWYCMTWVKPGAGRSARRADQALGSVTPTCPWYLPPRSL